MSNSTGEPGTDLSPVDTDASAKDQEAEKNGNSSKSSQKEGEALQIDETQPQGMVMMDPGLRSPMQTRVRRISAEIRLSASSNATSLKKVGKGLSSGLQNVASKLAMPKSLRRRSWHYEDVDAEDNLLDPADSLDERAKSASSENLRKTKNAPDTGDNDAPSTIRSDKTFLRRKWEARKSNNKEQIESKPEEKKNKKTSEGNLTENAESETVTTDNNNEAPALSLDSIPIVFEPLSIGQRPLTPTVTIHLDDGDDGVYHGPQNSKNSFLD